MDEPALRELLPLRRADREAYLDWAMRAFRLATSGAADATQIHTHMCYTEFGEIIDAIAVLDADVTSVEAARVADGVGRRSDRRWLRTRHRAGRVGHPLPPRARGHRDDRGAVAVLRAVDADRLWVNPDCGLKTRGYAETEAALRNLVMAARQARVTVAR